jgi:hypothetical protein
MASDLPEPETHTVERSRVVRLTEAMLGVALLVFAALMVLWAFRANSRDGVTLCIFGALTGFIGALGLARSRVQTEQKPTEAAQAAKAAEVEAAAQQQKEFFNRPYIRYPAGIAVLWIGWWLYQGLTSRGHGADWVLWGACAMWVGYGLWLTREVSKWVIGVAGIVAAVWFAGQVLGDIGKMPTSAAIIVGACIIAYAISATRKR